MRVAVLYNASVHNVDDSFAAKIFIQPPPSDAITSSLRV